MLPIDKLPSAPYLISLVTRGTLKAGTPLTLTEGKTMIKSLKNLLGLSLLAFFGVWMGCSSDSSPVSPSNKAVTDDGGSATQVSTFTVSRDVDFGDTKLRDAVMLKLGIHAPAVPTEADMDSLRVLKASGQGITSLRGLEHAENLDTLILDANKIKDLTPLAGLDSLEYLSLQRNGLADVTPLRNLTNLEELHLYTNEITDASSLVGLTKLKRLGIGGNYNLGSAQVGRLVADMDDLVWLKINANRLDDISFLEGMDKLENLNISGNGGITNFKPLTCLDALKFLHLRSMPQVGLGTGIVNDHIQYLINIGVTIYHTHTQ